MKKVLLFFLVCPIFWFLLFHLGTLFYEWSKLPFYMSHGVGSLFSIDKIRYSVELNGDSFLTRIFFNKISYLVGVGFNALSLLSPRNFFIGQDFELIPIIFLPFWFVGIYKLIKRKKILWFILVFVAAIFVYLTGQTSSYFMVFLVPFYIYAICESFS